MVESSQATDERVTLSADALYRLADVAVYALRCVAGTVGSTDATGKMGILNFAI